MGEQPGNVFHVGSPAIDALHDIKPAEILYDLLLLQHPIGSGDVREARRMHQTLRATRGFRRLVMTPNTDPGSQGIRAALREAKVNAVHLPRTPFLAALAGVRAMVGNSSAGLIEAAALKIPCVNIGPRQAGRQWPYNVIDCDYGEANVCAALKQALQLDRRYIRHPYGKGDAGERIAQRLAAVDLGTISIHKRNAY